MPPEIRPTVIGLYGLPASGKSHILRSLQKMPDGDAFIFFEGADMISALAQGGRDGFKQMNDSDKTSIRESAIREIQATAKHQGKPAVVTGHYSLWNSKTRTAEVVWTEADLETFTHIIYIKTAPEMIFARARSEIMRTRELVAVRYVDEWQRVEEKGLRSVAKAAKVAFIAVETDLLGMETHITKLVRAIIRDFCVATPETSLGRAKRVLEDVLDHKPDVTHTIFIDADKTLAPVDTGLLLCRMIDSILPEMDAVKTLKLIFTENGYTFDAFRQASLFFEQLCSHPYVPFNGLCREASELVRLYPAMETFLREASQQDHIALVIVTCELETIWRRVIKSLQLENPPLVVGDCGIDDGCIMTPEIKSLMVAHVEDIYKHTTYAIGDSPVDIEMLKAADRAFVVVPDENIRSRSMATVLASEIHDCFMPSQIVLSSHTDPVSGLSGLPTTTLPVLLSELIMAKVVEQRRIIHFTNTNAAKLLATRMRDSSIAGLQLRKVHKQVGKYLTLQELPFILGVEQYDIEHVQGNLTQGFRIQSEDRITIIALMRGGEPMALGVNTLLPSAMFVHANDPEDVKRHHIEGQSTFILVDSVVNSGKSAVEFLHHVRALSDTIRIVIVAGVVQSDCLKREGLVGAALLQDENLHLVALRVSENKYTGTGGTDTGNRLFNTKHLA